MNKIRVGIDLDGVLWDLTKYWIDEYNKVTGESINVDDIKSDGVFYHVHNNTTINMLNTQKCYGIF